jgi:quinol monooxygenase YgiN
MRHAIQGRWIAQEQEFMRSCLALLMMFQAGFTGTASAQDAAVYVVTYVEILPQSMEGAIAVLKADTAAGREDDGCRSMRLLRDVGRDNRFAILAIWKDGDAFEAHSKAQHAQRLRDQLRPIQVAAPDERVHIGFWLSPTPTRPSPDALWVVTHVDVPPPRKDDVAVILKQLAEHSTGEPGNVRFDVVQQISRPNHFTVSEIWSAPESFDAHLAAAHTKQFREQLGPMLGALYDQRLYHAID